MEAAATGVGENWHPTLEWRQADCSLGKYPFFHVLEVSAAPASAAAAIGTFGENVGIEPCEGVVVLSQSCDIVRTVEEYPFVEVAPLVPADSEFLAEVKACRRPRYAIVPGVEERGLVADFGRIMSLRKDALSTLPRTVGCRDDHEARKFGSAIARKFSRFAFPDDFIRMIGPLRKRLTKRHGRDSPEGVAVSALYEVRVRAAPKWDESRVEIHLWFIWDELDEPSQQIEWPKWCDEWLGLIQASEKYVVTGQSAGLEDLTAREYTESDPLDLDHLSTETET